MDNLKVTQALITEKHDGVECDFFLNEITFNGEIIDHKKERVNYSGDGNPRKVWAWVDCLDGIVYNCGITTSKATAKRKGTHFVKIENLKKCCW